MSSENTKNIKKNITNNNNLYLLGLVLILLGITYFILNTTSQQNKNMYDEISSMRVPRRG